MKLLVDTVYGKWIARFPYDPSYSTQTSPDFTTRCMKRALASIRKFTQARLSANRQNANQLAIFTSMTTQLNSTRLEPANSGFQVRRPEHSATLPPRKLLSRLCRRSCYRTDDKTQCRYVFFFFDFNSKESESYIEWMYTDHQYQTHVSSSQFLLVHGIESFLHNSPCSHYASENNNYPH